MYTPNQILKNAKISTKNKTAHKTYLIIVGQHTYVLF